jgi:hypothetical protein
MNYLYMLYRLLVRLPGLGRVQALETRMRLAGRICYSCDDLLRPPYTRQERHCHACKPHRVYMSFVYLNGWRCRFHDDDLAKTPISSLHIFRTQQKLYEAARRGHGLKDLASARSLDEAIATGRGGIWLDLTDEQYSSVKMTLKCNQTAA